MNEGTKVAVLGAGIMGAAMARNLLAEGMEVRALNRSREKITPLRSSLTAAASTGNLRRALLEFQDCYVNI